jgi:hypothetical protein
LFKHLKLKYESNNQTSVLAVCRCAVVCTGSYQSQATEQQHDVECLHTLHCTAQQALRQWSFVGSSKLRLQITVEDTAETQPGTQSDSPSVLARHSPRVDPETGLWFVGSSKLIGDATTVTPTPVADADTAVQDVHVEATDRYALLPK